MKNFARVIGLLFESRQVAPPSPSLEANPQIEQSESLTNSDKTRVCKARNTACSIFCAVRREPVVAPLFREVSFFIGREGPLEIFQVL